MPIYFGELVRDRVKQITDDVVWPDDVEDFVPMEPECSFRAELRMGESGLWHAMIRVAIYGYGNWPMIGPVQTPFAIIGYTTSEQSGWNREQVYLDSGQIRQPAWEIAVEFAAQRYLELYGSADVWSIVVDQVEEA